MDTETEDSLRIIDRFDRLIAEHVEVDALAAQAAEVTQRVVGVDEWLTGLQFCYCAAGSLVEAAPVARRVQRAAVASQLRGRRALQLDLECGDSVLAVSVEQASGRSGVVWAHHQEGRDWSIADQIALERLALAVSVRALERHDVQAGLAQERGALEPLLCDEPKPEQARALARRAGLDDAAAFLVIVVSERPAGAHSAETLLATLVRGLRDSGIQAAGTLIGREPVIVAKSSGDWRACLGSVASNARTQGWSLRAGVGSDAAVEGLGGSLLQARQALQLESIVAGDEGVACYEDLGVVRLLALIPSVEVLRERDVQRIAQLDGSSGGVTDLAILAAYCETGSLRKTASILFMHHTSIHYRIRRLERSLDVDLASPQGRMRALLAVRLVQINRLRSIETI